MGKFSAILLLGGAIPIQKNIFSCFFFVESNEYHCLVQFIIYFLINRNSFLPQQMPCNTPI